MNTHNPRSGLDVSGKGHRASVVNCRDMREGIDEDASLFVWPSAGAVDDVEDAEISNLEPIASYNWLDTPSPTIAVPGSPPCWVFNEPVRVPKDTAAVYVDINGDKMPSSPLTPLICAVRYWSPDFDLSAIDVVSDRNCLKKLVGWAAGDSENEFRIDVELAGETLLLTRWERQTRDARPGFGHTVEFLKAATRQIAGCENSQEHHRIVTYDFAGLKLLVRFTVDAYVAEEEEARAPAPGDDNDLLRDMSLLGLDDSEAPDPQPVLPARRSSNNTAPLIDIIPAGSHLVPQSSLIHVKTRSKRQFGVFDWQSTLAQLYFSGVPNLYLGVHDKGYFESISTRDPASILNGDDEAASLSYRSNASQRKVGGLLAEIRKVVAREHARFVQKGVAKPLFSLLSRTGELWLYQRKGGVLLPEELRAAFSTVHCAL